MKRRHFIGAAAGAAIISTLPKLQQDERFEILVFTAGTMGTGPAEHWEPVRWEAITSRNIIRKEGHKEIWQVESRSDPSSGYDYLTVSPLELRSI